MQHSEKEAFFSMAIAKYLSRLLTFLPRPVDFPVIAEWGLGGVVSSDPSEDIHTGEGEVRKVGALKERGAELFERCREGPAKNLLPRKTPEALKLP